MNQVGKRYSPGEYEVFRSAENEDQLVYYVKLSSAMVEVLESGEAKEEGLRVQFENGKGHFSVGYQEYGFRVDQEDRLRECFEETANKKEWKLIGPMKQRIQVERQMREVDRERIAQSVRKKEQVEESRRTLVLSAKSSRLKRKASENASSGSQNQTKSTTTKRSTSRSKSRNATLNTRGRSTRNAAVGIPVVDEVPVAERPLKSAKRAAIVLEEDEDLDEERDAMPLPTNSSSSLTALRSKPSQRIEKSKASLQQTKRDLPPLPSFQGTQGQTSAAHASASSPTGKPSRTFSRHQKSSRISNQVEKSESVDDILEREFGDSFSSHTSPVKAERGSQENPVKASELKKKSPLGRKKNAGDDYLRKYILYYGLHRQIQEHIQVFEALEKDLRNARSETERQSISNKIVKEFKNRTVDRDQYQRLYEYLKNVPQSKKI